MITIRIYGTPYTVQIETAKYLQSTVADLWRLFPYNVRPVSGRLVTDYKGD